ncbi:hypothetical protein TIFTF001_056774 [Ficus carica]|uniref:Uncharacterized protein n=1 Tax=Ficus carica TaxID=3494 RepID=A0AA88EK65_FICCA|nr:hypothetical protein TIFTF001_056663 [Ficus carica]GMN75252.1 hypothetical protein TIFTF001_056667 [Ficus carica]GMN75445.1 hypothetical protein TIFTF001_056772 [Ficus carica]GMN75448.1 hypothetical protein TIFTF001_056774 [Ficus carica]
MVDRLGGLTGQTLISSAAALWPGWPPRPKRAPWVCEGRGEGPGQGVTADGHPPSGVAPAVVSPRYTLARLAAQALARPWGARGTGRRPKPRWKRCRSSTYGCGTGSGDGGSPYCGAILASRIAPCCDSWLGRGRP